MTKRSFVTLLLSTIGDIIFALGMCMCLLPDWNAFSQGVVCDIIGGIILLIMVIYRLKTRETPFPKPSKKAVGITALTTIGVLVLGVGMCMTMVWEGLMIPGIIVGIVGIVLLLCLIPACKGLK